MSRTKELVKNTLIITVGKFSTQIVSFFLLPLYTAKLTTEEYGSYDLVATISMFIVPIITMLLEESMFRFLIDAKSLEDKRKIISHTFILVMINSILFIIIMIFSYYILKIELSKYILIYSLGSALIALTNALTRGEGKIALYSLSNFLLSILTIFLSIFFIVYLKMGFKALILSNVLSNVLVSLIVLKKMNLFSYLSLKQFEICRIKKMLKYSIPLVPNTICWAIINVSDRLFIVNFIGAGANGIYSISNKFPNIINNFYSFFNTAWRESSARIINDGTYKNEYPKIFSSIQKLMFSTTIIITAFMPFVFKVLVNEKYISGLMYIPVLTIAVYYSSLSGYFGGIFTAFKDTKIIGVTSFLAAIINLVINIILIKKIGVFAAALSTLISSLFLYYIRKRKVKNIVDLKFNYKKELLYFIIFVMITLLFFSNNTLIKLLNTTLSLIISLIICNKEISIFIKKISEIKRQKKY